MLASRRTKKMSSQKFDGIGAVDYRSKLTEDIEAKDKSPMFPNLKKNVFVAMLVLGCPAIFATGWGLGWESKQGGIACFCILFACTLAIGVGVGVALSPKKS